jgi:hypothetical protein
VHTALGTKAAVTSIKKINHSVTKSLNQNRSGEVIGELGDEERKQEEKLKEDTWRKLI